MKVNSPAMMPQVERLQPRAARSAPGSAESSAQPSADVEVTGGARLVAEVRSQAATISEVRADEVARARADVASGELLTDVEIDAAVDALLAGL